MKTITFYRHIFSDNIHVSGLLLVFALFIFIYPARSQKISTGTDPGRQWTGYRGTMASGVFDRADLPDDWNVKSDKNIKWTAEIPGLGLSCPVIWENKVFITTAVSKMENNSLKTGIFGDVGSVEDNTEHEWNILCLDRNNGKVIWERTACTGIPKIKRHPKSTHANCTVTTDGKHVLAFFGSEGLYCYDMDGHLAWSKNFGILRSVFFAAESAEWEFASSPVLYDNKVIIQCDVMENSFLAALDAGNGNIIWKVDRDDFPTWSTPNIYVNEGSPVIVVNGYKHMGGYDLDTGREIWRMSGGGDIPIPTPLIGEDLIYLNSAHGKQSPIIAIKKSAKGDITLEGDRTSNEFVAWSLPKEGPYMQTMVIYDGLLYSCRWNGVISCYDALTGERLYREKLGNVESFTASPVIADGKLYISDDDGTVYTVRTGKEFSVLNTSSLGDVCMTSPAITEGMMIFRTQHHLVAVGK